MREKNSIVGTYEVTETSVRGGSQQLGSAVLRVLVKSTRRSIMIYGTEYFIYFVMLTRGARNPNVYGGLIIVCPIGLNYIGNCIQLFPKRGKKLPYVPPYFHHGTPC